MCDDNCNISLNKTNIKIFKNNKVVIQGKRNRVDGLWDIHLPKIKESKIDTPTKQTTNSTEHINVIVRLDKCKSDLDNYLHGCLFSTNTTTLQKAINNKQLLTFPGIEKINFNKYMIDNISTQVGHIKHEINHLRSTKQNATIDNDEILNFFPPKEEKGIYHNVSSVYTQCKRNGIRRSHW